MTVFWIPKELAKPSSRSLSPMVTLADLQAVVGDDVRLGVTDCAPFPEVAQTIEARVSEGLNGGLGFTYAAPDVATRPLVSFPWGRSIVVAAVPYLVDGDGDDPRRSVARFADGDRYGNVRRRLRSWKVFLSTRDTVSSRCLTMTGWSIVRSRSGQELRGVARARWL